VVLVVLVVLVVQALVMVLLQILLPTPHAMPLPPLHSIQP
jgi:hypothetical protein